MQWYLLQSHFTTEQKHNKIIESLNKELEAGKQEIWGSHEQVVAADSRQTNNEEEDDGENEDPNHVVTVASTTTTGKNSNTNIQKNEVAAEKAAENNKTANTTSLSAAAAPTAKGKKRKGYEIQLVVTEGFYEGESFVLQPTLKTACFVGRSTAKKFKDKGISLSKDGEVSTTHGKFEIIGGRAYYTDMGSTNGSLYEGEELEDNVPLELKKGMVLQLGGTVLKIDHISLA